MREVFNRVEDNELVKIEVDLAAKDFEESNPWLFSIFIKYDGLDDSDEKMAEFFEIKESLIIALEYKDISYYAGNRLVDNWSELYFYAPDSKGLDAIATDILKPTGYIFECNVVKDSKWEFYDFNIFPTDIEIAMMQSYKIMTLLEEEGDDLEVVREVEHYASFQTASQKDRFVEKVQKLGYSYKDDLDADEFDNGVAVVKEHCVTEEELIKIVSEIFALVKEEHGEYELWSTLIQEKE